MECRNARALVDDYLDGALDDKTRARVEAHLGTCGLCRSAFDEARRYRDAVSGLPRVKVPDDFLRGIHDRLGAETARRKRWELFTRSLPKTIPFGAAAAAVAAFALIFVFHSQRPKIERPSEHGAVYELQAPREEKNEAAETARSMSPKSTPAPAHKAGEIKSKSAPVAITLVLERPPQVAGASPPRETETKLKAETAQNAVSAREAESKRLGTRPDDKIGDETQGEVAGPSLDQTRDELASIIMKAGGRIAGTDAGRAPGDAVLTVLAEIPALELAGFLERLEGLGRIQTDRALSRPESAGQGESVELRIRLTYRPIEDTDPR